MPPMQTQSTPTETQIGSLDRTDVLPVLDVEAYEATLAESQKTLSRTDTWTVDALQDIDALIESATHEGPVEVRSINVNRDAAARKEGVTVNVDRILKRIADLEADIVKAQDANAVMLTRNEALQAERDEHAARVEALKAEQARLAEHRALAEEMAQRSQKQLRDEVQRLEERLKETDRTLTAEKASAAELARRFAAKLSEHDKLVAIIEQHNRTVDGIVAVRDDLDLRLRNELDTSAELKAKLVAAEETMSANRALLLEREGALAEEAGKQAELAAQIDELNKSLQAAEARVQDAHNEVTVAAKARGDEERRRLEAEGQMREAHAERDSIIAERDSAQSQIRALRDDFVAMQTEAQASEQMAQERADEIVAMRAKFEEYEGALRDLEEQLEAQRRVTEGLQAQLQTAHDECSIMADQREKARARAKQLSQEIFRRDHRIEELKADLAVHTEALAAIRRDVNRIGEKAAPATAEDVEWVLEPIEHSGEILRLTGSMLTIGRTAENDIALASKMVSRHHARLLIGPTGIIVEDAGSTNGCFVNGEQVKQHLMHDNDVLELGDLRYKLRLRSTRETSVRANVVPLFEQNPE